MKQELKILIIWGISLLGLGIVLLLPSAPSFEPMALINTSLQILLCILSVQIARKSSGTARHIFSCFAFFFGFSILIFANSFVGTVFHFSSSHANFYYRVYVSKIGMNFRLLFLLLFILANYFITKKSIALKYALAVSVSAIIVLWFSLPFSSDPMQLKHEKEYAILSTLVDSSSAITKRIGREPNEAELTQALIGFSQHGNNSAIQIENPAGWVKKLLPRMNKGGITTVFWKPLNLISLYINSIALLLISIFLFHTYRYNKAHSSYIDKILIILFLNSALEILHLYGYINSISSGTYQGIFLIGQYFTVISWLLMVYPFNLKLRFVYSPLGQYYEEKIETNPEHVTRWRDEIDNAVLKAFSKNTNYINQFAITEKSTSKG